MLTHQIRGQAKPPPPLTRPSLADHCYQAANGNPYDALWLAIQYPRIKREYLATKEAA